MMDSMIALPPPGSGWSGRAEVHIEGRGLAVIQVELLLSRQLVMKLVSIEIPGKHPMNYPVVCSFVPAESLLSVDPLGHYGQKLLGELAFAVKRDEENRASTEPANLVDSGSCIPGKPS